MSNSKRQIFYSFHYKKDFWRVQQIRNIGVIESNIPVSSNEWEEVKRKGKNNIEMWIDSAMRYRSCIVVLIGEETASREWVKYEIKRGWDLGKGVVGIYIHNLKNQEGKTSQKGKNPFEYFSFQDGRKLSDVVKCYNPNTYDAYNDIRNNIQDWVEEAIRIRNSFS